MADASSRRRERRTSWSTTRASATGRRSPTCPLERIRAVFEVNFFGAVHCTKAFLPAMLERRQGTIVFVSSGFGELPFPYTAAYCASKHALNGFAGSLRAEVEPLGVRVLLVMPGRTRTAFFEANTYPAGVLSRYLLQRAVPPERGGAAHRPGRGPRPTPRGGGPAQRPGAPAGRRAAGDRGRLPLVRRQARSCGGRHPDRGPGDAVTRRRGAWVAAAGSVAAFCADVLRPDERGLRTLQSVARPGDWTVLWELWRHGQIASAHRRGGRWRSAPPRPPCPGRSWALTRRPRRALSTVRRRQAIRRLRAAISWIPSERRSISRRPLHAEAQRRSRSGSWAGSRATDPGWPRRSRGVAARRAP